MRTGKQHYPRRAAGGQAAAATRRRGRRAQVLGELTPRGPLHFARVLRYQLRGAREPVDREFRGCYRRVLALPDGPALVEVRPDHPARTLRLEVRALNRRLGPDEAAAACEQVSRIYSLDFDARAFHRAARAEPPLAAVAMRFCGLRVAGVPEPFECVVWSILGQQISLAVAIALKQRLVEAYAEFVERDGERYPAFPSAARLADAGEPALGKLGLSRPKARYVSGLAREVASGRLDLHALRALPPEGLHARLRELEGVGPWTASYVALRAYGDADALPLADVGLERAATQAYSAPERLRGAALARVAERWRPYRGWATFYLWYSLMYGRERAVPRGSA